MSVCRFFFCVTVPDLLRGFWLHNILPLIGKRKKKKNMSFHTNKLLTNFLNKLGIKNKIFEVGRKSKEYESHFIYLVLVTCSFIVLLLCVSLFSGRWLKQYVIDHWKEILYFFFSIWTHYLTFKISMNFFFYWFLNKHFCSSKIVTLTTLVKK